MASEHVYVSITGLQIRAFWHAPMFWWHAVRSMSQARNADGNISADARSINGVHHTLSVWRDKAAMRAFLTSGAHAKAMKSFRSIATGKTLGFETNDPPSWADVHEIWRTRGRDY